MFWLEKDISKVENTLLQWILQNILENQTFQRIAKFIMADFYEMDFMKGIVISVKVDECTISWSLLGTVYWSRDDMEMDYQSFLLKICPYIYRAPL